jgi:hypothetical protein
MGEVIARRWIFFFTFVVWLLALSLAACHVASDTVAGTSVSLQHITTSQNATQDTRTMTTNTTVMLGKAMDSKSGAVLVAADGRVVYVEGLDYWPSDLTGKTVSVTGILTKKKLIPDPLVGSGGAISQGSSGQQEVFEQATWKAVD